MTHLAAAVIGAVVFVVLHPWTHDGRGALLAYLIALAWDWLRARRERSRDT